MESSERIQENLRKDYDRFRLIITDLYADIEEAVSVLSANNKGNQDFIESVSKVYEAAGNSDFLEVIERVQELFEDYS